MAHKWLKMSDKALTKIVQAVRCPEAMHWTAGDLVLMGKGSNAWYFRVVGKQSSAVALMRYVRRVSCM